VGGFDIPGFDIEKMRNLRNTVGEGDAIRTIMACHYSSEGEERYCIGYVAQEGWTNIAVRIACAYGRLNINAIDEACADLDLWPDFHSMLAAYEEAQS
jgi:hypothetical protein